MRIGILGTGRMGTAIGLRLKESGHDLVAWNRTRERAAGLSEAGAEIVDTPADAVQRSEVVISSLTDAPALDAVYLGPDGALSGDLGGKVVIEMSTVRPDDIRRLGGKVRDAGGVFVECPVGGTVGPARQGKLFGFAGGEKADVDRARPVLELLCRRIEHVGSVGSGAIMKLAINLPLVVSWQTFGEAFTLCRRLGLEPQHLVDIFTDTSGATTALKNRAAAVASALAGEKVPGTFDIDSMRKDMRAMLEEAASLGAELPLTSHALECFDQGADAGLGACDGANQSAFWSERVAKR